MRVDTAEQLSDVSSMMPLLGSADNLLMEDAGVTLTASCLLRVVKRHVSVACPPGHTQDVEVSNGTDTCSLWMC